MKIALAGDVMLGRLVNDYLKKSSLNYSWGDTLPLFHKADLRICNLECVLSDIGQPWYTPKAFHFRSDEKNVQVLKAAQIDLVSLANNHVLDYEYEALTRMLKVLNREKIKHAGAGANFSEASQPVICNIQNQKIAFVAFTDNEPGWAARENHPGIFYVPTKLQDQRFQAFLEQIADLKKNVNFLIVSAHWGGNWGYDPPQEHVEMAHQLIDCGADLIFGHSCHVFRGVEVYKNRPIIYSAGDFIDDYAVDEVEKNDESFLFILEKEDAHLKLNMYPVFIDQFQVNLAKQSTKQNILLKMEKLCQNLGSKTHDYGDHLSLVIN